MIPDLMPILSKGSHRSPRDGACIMEMASFLSGATWSDSPPCTHPVLAKAAQVVNDRLSDDERHVLLPLLPRLMGTAPTGTEYERHVLSVRLAVWCGRHVLPMTLESDRAACERALARAAAWCRGEATGQECRAAAAYTARYAAAAYAAINAAYAASAAASVAAYTSAAANAAAYTAYTYAPCADADLVAFLTGLLDEHDRLTARTHVEPITDDQHAALVALTI